MNVRHVIQAILGCSLLCFAVAGAQEGRRMPPLPPNPLPYDLLLKGGHVLDDANKIDATRDVGIKDECLDLSKEWQY